MSDDEATLVKRCFQVAGYNDPSFCKQVIETILRRCGLTWGHDKDFDEFVEFFLRHVQKTDGGAASYSSFVDWICGSLVPAATVPPAGSPPLSARTEELRTLFRALDTDNDGALDADELFFAVSNLNYPELSEEAINAMIIEADSSGDGRIQLAEFAQLINPPHLPESLPHLILNFDVNQTVIILDSAINADPEALLNSLLSNTCWGRIVEDEAGAAPCWEVVSSEPALRAPEPGLQTYLQYVVQITPIAKDAELAAVKAAKQLRRKLIQSFASSGQPGESLAHHLVQIRQALRLPESLLDAAGADLLASLGLSTGSHLLLPSFMRALRSLKAQGRSFSVCFRTFGKDLPKIAPEYNALCEGRHPYFQGEPAIVLDGSDGGADLRMDLTPGCNGFGTWVRDGSNLSLVMGTLEQPPIEKANAAELPGFYAQQGLQVSIANGASNAASQLKTALKTGRTLALRDYYPGWEAHGCKADGGKPLLLELDCTSELAMFFDDHINPNDAHIVDVRRASAPLEAMLPIGAVLGTYLHRAEPLLSIMKPDYFTDTIARAEENWRLKFSRRAALARALDAVKQAVSKPKGRRGSKYKPHACLDDVVLASNMSVSEVLDDG